MSYARYGRGKRRLRDRGHERESDVYVIADMSGNLRCYCPDGFFKCSTTGQMMSHLNRHRRDGYQVPAYTFTSLYRDRIENDQYDPRLETHSPEPTPGIADTCCGKCPCATCYVDQITGA